MSSDPRRQSGNLDAAVLENGGFGGGSRRRYRPRARADTALGGQRVIVELLVRQFRCEQPGCAPRTFVEPGRGADQAVCPVQNSLMILARMLSQNLARNLTAKQVEYAHVIHSAGADLLQLINDILDLSKVEAGKMEIHMEHVSLRALLEDLRATFHPITEEKGLEFTVDVAPDAPTELFTDSQRVSQVLRNLLSNAVKFTEQGSVELRIRTTEGPDGAAGPRKTVAFSVVDTGVGIADDDLDRLFEAFQQGEGTTNRRYGGTGLGLSISREVAALLDGEIHAHSELGRGSTFTLYLPLHSPAPASGPTPAAEQPPHDTAAPAVANTSEGPAHEDHRLLVLEAGNNGLLALLANSAAADIADSHGPIRITTVTSPEDALEALSARSYHCVLLDLALPDAGAFTFLDGLQRNPVTRRLPVLVHPTRPLGAAQERLTQARFRTRPLELLLSLDPLRERIMLHLSTANLDEEPALTRDVTEPVE